MFNQLHTLKIAALCSCFALISSTGFSQEETAKAHKWAVGVNISPEMAYRHLHTEDEFLSNLIESRDEWEKPMFTFTAGVSAEYQLSKRFRLKAGIHYSVKGEAGSFESWIPPTTAPGSPIVPAAFKFNYRYHSIGVPIAASFDFFQHEKINLFVSAGIALNYLHRIVAESELTLSDSGTTIEKNEIDPRDDPFTDYNLFNPAGLVSFGADVHLGSRSKLRIEPVFRHSLLPVADTPIKEYQFNGGLNIGYLFLL